MTSESKKDFSDDKTVGPGLKLFSTLTGESIEDIRKNPRTSLRGLQKLGTMFKDIFTDQLSSREETRGASKQRLEELKQTFRSHGINVPSANQSEMNEEEKKRGKANHKTSDQGKADTVKDKYNAKTVMQNKLQRILEEAVGKLENIAREVLPKEALEKMNLQRKTDKSEEGSERGSNCKSHDSSS